MTTDVMVITTSPALVEQVKDHLEAMGLVFVKEKHGNGPEHYACEKDGKVLEIYPGLYDSVRWV